MIRTEAPILTDDSNFPDTVHDRTHVESHERTQTVPLAQVSV